MYRGVFLACLGALFLEVLATRVLAIVQGPETVYYTVAVAMLGMGAAGSLISVIRLSPDEGRARGLATVFCVLASLSVVLLFAFARVLKEVLNTRADASFSVGGLEDMLLDLSDYRVEAGILLGAMMSIPYFFYGAALAVLFRSADGGMRARLYGADMIGAAAGCLLAILALEVAGFALPLGLAVAAPLLAAASFARVERPGLAGLLLAAAVIAGGAVQVPAVTRILEPRPHLIRLAKLWVGQGEARELWHTWNSYSRVAALEVTKGDPPRVDVVMALGIGEGHAGVRPYRGSTAAEREDEAYLPVSLATAACDPRRVLVLFAGVGRDMVALDEHLGGRAEIVGVEINQQVLDWPLEQAPWRLREFFDRPGITMEVAEAREWLGQDKTRFDSILLSWSGANISYLTGAAGHAARFVYTLEGFTSILDHLEPGGQITILNTNKIKALAALRSAFQDRSGPDLSACVVVLDRPGQPRSDWRRHWDENRLLVKPDGFTSEDLERIHLIASEWGLRVRCAPGLQLPDDDPYSLIIRTPDLDQALRALGPPNMLDFSVATDDRPFILDLFPAEAFLTREFWAGRFAKVQDDSVALAWWIRRDHAKTLLFFALASLVLVGGPLIVARRGVPLSRASFEQLVFFGAIGAGYVFIEVGFMQKLALYLGHPGSAIAIVLASQILFTGLGSLASNWTFRRGILGFRSAALLSAVLAAGLFVAVDTFSAEILALRRLPRVGLIFFAMAPLGFAMGHLFSQGLARIAPERRALVPWAFAVNAVTGTLAAGLAIPLAQALGFRAVIGLGIGAYLVVALLRHRVRS